MIDIIEKDEQISIEDFIKRVLQKRFPNSVIKQKIEIDKVGNKINFACPYCGDSEKKESKKRGNIFFNTQTYKCFNDGCMKYTTINNFIKYFHNKYKIPIPTILKKDKILEKNTNSNKNKLSNKNLLFNIILENKKNNFLIDFNEFIEKFCLIPVDKIDLNSNIGKYLDSRKLLNNPIFNKTCCFDSSGDKIYIFNLDFKSNKILGLSIRRISNNKNLPKYDIKNYSKLSESGIIKGISNEYLDKLNTINNYFNIFNIDFNKTVIVTEGQFDSMFLNNSIAISGVTKSKSFLRSIFSKNKLKILFDNDRAGKENSIQLLKEGYSVFLWSKLLHSLNDEYPGKYKEIKKIKDINDLYVFLFKNDQNLTLESFNNKIMKYFSESKLDIFLV